MAKQAVQYKVGDVVKWTSEFLKNTCQYHNVPKNGRVIRMADMETDKGIIFPVVHWCNHREDESCAVHPGNIMMAKKPDTSGL
jgi:hypothetical protein